MWWMLVTAWWSCYLAPQLQQLGLMPHLAAVLQCHQPDMRKNQLTNARRHPQHR